MTAAASSGPGSEYMKRHTSGTSSFHRFGRSILPAIISVLVVIDLAFIIVYRYVVGVDVVFAILTGMWWGCCLWWVNVAQLMMLRGIWRKRMTN